MNKLWKSLWLLFVFLGTAIVCRFFKLSEPLASGAFGAAVLVSLWLYDLEAQLKAKKPAEPLPKGPLPTYSPQEELKAYKTLIEGSWEISLLMNDTFGFACADSESMSDMDVEPMIPIIAEYGRDALVAYAAVKRGQEPITCSCNHKNERYQAAKVKIEALKAADPENFAVRD